MKKMILLFTFLLLGCIYANTIQAQSVVVKDLGIEFMGYI